jgi:endonuclease YncB( thermonuclease family)
MSQKLTECNPKEIEKFTICGNYEALVWNVYDGDTCTCIMDFNNNLHKFSVRLTGIDTAEMKSKDPELKKKAVAAKQYLSSMILNKIVRLECEGLDKYGRILAKLYVDDICMNTKMIELKYANSYDGGTKSLEFPE